MLSQASKYYGSTSSPRQKVQVVWVIYRRTEKNTKIKDDTDKAMILVEFFSSVFTEEPEGDMSSLDISLSSMGMYALLS